MTAAGDGQKVDGGGQALGYEVPHSPDFVDVYTLAIGGSFTLREKERLLTLLASERQYRDGHAHSQELRAAAEDGYTALRLAGHVIVEHLDHWCECPLPPDGGCDRCRLFVRALDAFRAAAASSGDLPSPSPWGSDKGGEK